MFAHGSHSRTVHADHEASSHPGDCKGVRSKGAIPDDLADTGFDIEHRSKAKINAHGTKLSRHQPAGTLRQIFIPLLRVDTRGREPGEPLPESLDPPALMVDGNQEIRTNGANFGNQGRDLFDRRIVSPKQNNAACSRVLKAFALDGIHLVESHVDHDRANSPLSHLLAPTVVGPAAPAGA